jgi:hypothetical protein
VGMVSMPAKVGGALRTDSFCFIEMEEAGCYTSPDGAAGDI